MLVDEMHREDIVATIRKRYRTVARFERVLSLPVKSVNEVLRGRPNARVRAALEACLAEAVENPVTIPPEPECSGDSEGEGLAHDLDAGAR